MNNKFQELARWCLASGSVRREIVAVLKNQNTGLRWFLKDMNIPLSTMQMVIACVSSSSTWDRESGRDSVSHSGYSFGGP